jgi:hypothetical protein
MQLEIEREALKQGDRRSVEGAAGAIERENWPT